MYIADKDRYSKMDYGHCGKSGLKLPKYLWVFGTTSVIQVVMKL